MNSTNSDNSSIELSVKDAGGIYRWTNATSGLENPELNLKVTLIILYKSKIQLTPNMILLQVLDWSSIVQALWDGLIQLSL